LLNKGTTRHPSGALAAVDDALICRHMCNVGCGKVRDIWWVVWLGEMNDPTRGVGIGLNRADIVKSSTPSVNGELLLVYR